MRRRDFLKLLAPLAAGAAVAGPAIAAAVRDLVPVPVTQKSFSIHGRPMTIGGAFRVGPGGEMRVGDLVSMNERGELIAVHEFDAARAMRDGDTIEADWYLGMDGAEPRSSPIGVALERGDAGEPIAVRLT